MRSTKSGVLLGDQRADALFLLLDENGDGDALDAGERLVFFDATNASGFLAPTNNIFTVIQAKDKTVYMGDGNTDAVYRLQDLNRDGDANDAGEAAIWFDASNAAGFSTVTPNGVAEGADGAIYIVNAGTTPAPQDAIYRTEDLNGDGDANDAGEATLWLDLQTVVPTSSAFDINFDGDVAYLSDTAGGEDNVILRIEDLNGDGDASDAGEVTTFISEAASFGAPIDFTHTIQDGSILSLGGFGAGATLYRLTDLDGSNDINDATEAVEVWNALAMPPGFSFSVGFNVESDEDGTVHLTAGDHVVTLTDLNGDGDYLDADETAILTSSQEDTAIDRPRALSTYEETVAPQVTTVGGGNHFSLFLDQDSNTLFAAGENVLGQLGNGAKGFDIKAPLPIALPDGFSGTIASVSAGLIHGSFLTEDGDVYSWGFGNFGRLGHGDSDEQLVAKKIEALDDIEIVRIENGNGASYAIDATGKLYAWGQNSNGQLGQSDEVNRDVPTLVEALHDETVIDVSSGTAHTIVLTADGDVYGFGSNIDGQVGSPDGLDPDGNPIREVLTPSRVTGLPDTVVAVTADTQSSFAVTADGEVYGWGENSFGQIGLGTDNGDGTFTPGQDKVLVPTKIEGLPDTIIDVKAGARWVIALTEDGDVYAWGPNDRGPTGALDGDPATESEGTFFPTLIPELDAVNVVEIATGPNSIIAVTDSGDVYTFGSNSDGRLGFPSDGSVYQPTLVDFDSDPEPYLVSATPGDNARDIDAKTAFKLTFTEEVFAGEGTIRLVNRDDPSDTREIAIDDERLVAFDGDMVTITPSAFLTPDARYAVEFDTGAFLDSDGNPVLGIEPGDTSTFNFTVSEEPTDTPIVENGTRDDDLLRGGSGNDKLKGKNGDDVLFGNDGDDRLTGNKGDDEMFGGDGDDRLNGNRGLDLLMGEDGDDRLRGGDGDDWLDGGAGNDRMNGGRGEDVFYFGADSGHDIIEDFETAWFLKPEDLLQLDVDGFDNKFDLLHVLEKDGHDLVFAFDEETSLTFQDTSFFDFIKMDIEFIGA